MLAYITPRSFQGNYRMNNLSPRTFRRAAIAASLLLTAACGPAGGPPGGFPPAPVSVITTETRDVPVILEYTAQTAGYREVEVRARVSGILLKRNYKEGSTVRVGESLFSIDPAPFKLAQARTAADLGVAEAQLQQAQRELARLKPVYEAKAVSQKEFDDTKSASAVSKAAMKSAEAAVRQAELNLSYTNVTAPVSGMSGRAQRSEGSLVNAGSDSLLTSISQINPIWIRFSLSDGDLQKLPGGRAAARNLRDVELQLPDGSIYPQRGQINFSASRIDALLGTMEMRAEFANADARILPGQFVRARVIVGEQDNVFLVPQAAVTQTENGPVLMLVGADDKVEPRPVKLGDWQGKNWVVTDGLKPGERVIVDNLIKLRPGAPVAPRMPGAGPADAQPKT